MNSGPNQLKRMGNSAKPSLPDDMIVGFIFSNLLMMITAICVIYGIYVAALLGYNLTNVRNITNEYDHFVKNSSLPSLINYVCPPFILSKYNAYHHLLFYRSLSALNQLKVLLV